MSLKPLAAALLAASFYLVPAQAQNSADLSPEAVNDTRLATPVGPRARGAAVLRAQVLLDRARFSPGEIDGMYGSNVAKAISGFQKSQGLPATGTIDEKTWAALNADTGAAIGNYTITAADVAGPYQTIPTDMVEKSKLSSLGYSSVFEALGEKFHSSPALLKRLNPGKAMQAGDVIAVPNIEAAMPTVKAAKIVVDKSDLTITALDASGKTLAQFPASVGSEHDPLPLGSWKITGVSKNPTFNYNPDLFWDADPNHSKAKIPSGPNSPVGVVWIDLTKEHYGIHGTPEPSTIGKTESHGCIRMTNWDAVALAELVAPQMEALLQE